MDQNLTPLRRLYSEPPVTGGEDGELTPEVHAEMEALEPIVAALGKMPRQRPDRQVIELVVAEAMHAPVRFLYGEDSPATLSDAHAKEARALAPLQQALDELPPQRPEQEVVDSAAAEATHPSVRHLYDGTGQEVILGQRAAEEARALAPVRDALDALARQRPDASVIDAVVAAAGSRTPAAPARSTAPSDRSARRSPRRIGRWVSTLAAVLLVGTAALWVMQQNDVPDGLVAEAELDQAAAAPFQAPDIGRIPGDEGRATRPTPQQDAVAQATPLGTAGTDVNAPSPQPRQAAPAAVPQGSPRPTAAPRAAAVDDFQVASAQRVSPAAAAAAVARLAATDVDQSDVRLLYMRLEALHGGDLAWDEGEVVLGADGARRTNPSAARGWMQVRVDR